MKTYILRLAALVALLVMSASSYAANSCSWNAPGVNPYTGSVPGAIDKYTDIPKEVRDKLKARMEKREYDDIASISRDDIAGKVGNYSNLRNMHFGNGRTCDTVDRSGWKPNVTERGLVYCEQNYCIIVPTVCRNVSRIDRDRGAAGAGAPAGPQAIAPPEAAVVEAAPMEGGGGGMSARALSADPVSSGGGIDSNPLVPDSNSPGIVAGPIYISSPPSVYIPPGVPPAVPEPETWAMFAGGMLVLFWMHRRRQNKA